MFGGFLDYYWRYKLASFGCKYVNGLRSLRRSSVVTIEPKVSIGELKIGPHQLFVGAHSYLRSGCEIYSDVEIGRFCSIANGVVIGVSKNQHPVSWLSTSLFTADMHQKYLGQCEKSAVQIGNDCWIGQEAMIMSGVRIGNGAVIGARSVVTGDVPAYAIAVGVPARVVRYRFPPETVERLTAVNWWNLPEEIIQSLDFADVERSLLTLEQSPASGYVTYPKLIMTRKGIQVTASPEMTSKGG